MEGKYSILNIESYLSKFEEAEEQVDRHTK